MKTTWQHVLLGAALAGTTLPASAQITTPLGAARVTLVAGKSPSKGGRTEVLRRAHLLPQNIVIVDRNATADDLAAALAMVGALRTQNGDALTDDYRARPETARHGPKWHKSEYRSWLHDQLVRLRKAPEREFADLGIVRAVQVTLPAPAGMIRGTEGGRE